MQRSFSSFNIICIFLGLILTKSISALDVNQPYSKNPEVQKFIEEMHKKHGLDKNKLNMLFSNITPDPSVIAAISKPFEEVPWFKYRERFLTDERAKEGVLFWKKNEAAIKKAAQQFGVPGEIIVAIIGVETYYGRYTGKHSVLRSLTTLAFYYPPRAKFFKSELEQFLLLAKEEKLNPSIILGSYAGAMGKPQFIASSYRRYAVDFSGTGQRDLINDSSDAIGSVANYFKQHGWKPEEPIAYKAQTFGKIPKFSNNPKDPKPNLTIAEFAKYNIKPNNAKLSKDKKAALLILQNPKNKEYWLGLNNFYVITRYNHSVNYAMAVFQLSERIRTFYKE